MKEIKKQIKENHFNKVYLLMGEEDYLINQAKKLLKNAMVGPDDEMNYMLIENSKIDYNSLSEYLMTLPFFSEKRVVILDRTDVIKNGKDQFLNILKSLPDTSCVIICENKVDKKTKAYKWIKNNQYVREFLKKDQTEKVLLKWIASMLARENKRIREADAAYFLERIGNDMYMLQNETAKLIAYVGDRDEIRREDIESISSGEVENKIFDMISAIAAGQKQKALSCYDDLIILREAPLRILALIVRQYRILLITRNMRSLRKLDSEIASKAGAPVFAIRKSAPLLSGYSQEDLEKCLNQCVQTEEDIKTGRIADQMGVETLILSLLER